MLCPECIKNRSNRVHKITVLDTVHNDKENEIYRKRQCRNCGYEFYTVEYEVEVNERFLNDWTKNHRLGKKK